MNFRFHTPSNPRLRQIVRFIAYMEIPAGQEGTYMSVFPNCTTNISITLGKKILIADGSKLSNFASTSCLSTVTFNRSRPIEMINIQFEPYGIFSILGIPMTELTNQMSLLDDFFKASDLERLYNQILESKSESQAVQRIEGFLLDALMIDQVDGRIASGVHHILSPDTMPMDRLSHDLNVSSRGLRKLFGRYLGISPKHYARLVRFNKATLQMVQEPGLSLTAIAADQGYYDQAHFIKDFKSFGGITPKAFRKLPHKSSDFYNFSQTGPVTFGIS